MTVAYDEVDWDTAYARPSEQERLDRIRVRGYTLACVHRVDGAKAQLEKCIDALLRARKDAEKALDALRRELDHAEEMGRFVALDDPVANEALAQALERLEEVE